MAGKAEIEVPYPRPRRILAIDPGERAGVAIYSLDGDRFLLDVAWEVGGASVKAIAGVMQEFVSASSTSTAMVIERQFMKWKEGAAGATKGFETLLYRRHVWEVIAQVFSVPVAPVYPISWQSKMLPKKKDLLEEDKDADTKARAKMACLERWPERATLWEQAENARDAALLGRFYANLVEDRIALA